MEAVTGMPELLAKLQALKKVKAKAMIRKGTRAGCKILQAAAKITAPHKTGMLSQKIKVRSITRSRRWVGTKVTLEIAYGNVTELGTKRHGVAQHYLQRSAKSVGHHAMMVCLGVIQQEISKL